MAVVSGPRADFVCFRCEENEPGSGGPFRDLPLTPKPACPRCRARRWMERQWSGYSPMISTNGDMQKFQAADRNVEAAMLAHDALKGSRLRAQKEAINAESVVPGINMRVRAISTQPGRIAAEVGGFGASVGGVAAGGSKPVPMQDPGGERMVHGAAKIMDFGRRNSILDPHPQATREAVGL